MLGEGYCKPSPVGSIGKALENFGYFTFCKTKFKQNFNITSKFSFQAVSVNDVIKDNWYIPDCLKVANVTPIFKKDDSLDKENYRTVRALLIAV